MLATFLSLFLSIFISSLPFLLLGALISGAVAVYIPTPVVLKFAARQSGCAIAVGCMLGLFFPVGDVGVLPLVRRLMQKGAPVPFGIALLLAAPSINLVALASTAVAFGVGPLFWGRIGLTLLVAGAAGGLFSLENDPSTVFRLPALGPDVVPPSASAEVEPVTGDPKPAQAEWRAKLNRLAFTTADDFFYFGTYLIPGILLAAGLRTLFPWLASPGAGAAPLLAVGNLAGLAFIYSSNAMEIAFTSLGFAGSVSFGPLLVFITLGSMLDIKRFPTLLALLRPKAAAYVVLLSILLVVVMGVLAAYLFA